MPVRKGTLVNESGFKKCSKCLQTKFKTEFGFLHITQDKLNGVCKKCENIRSTLQRTNCSEEKFNELYQKQNGKCAICESELNWSSKEFTPHVDHRHSDGLIRGLLCLNCNLGLGHSFDNINIIQNTIQYLYPIEYNI